MDQIDVALQESWHAVLERMASDPEERARRIARAHRVRERPVRPWCVAIRAADTRIDEWGISWTPDDLAARGLAHEFPLTQWDLVDLTRPVRLGPHPGVPISEAAKIMGRGHSVILRWAKAGALRALTYDKRIWGYHVGGPMVVVYSPSPVDPNAERARSPNRVWGTMWQELAKEIPRDWQCTLKRALGPHPAGGRGGRPWMWVCPGRGNGQMANGQMANGEREDGQMANGQGGEMAKGQGGEMANGQMANEQIANEGAGEGGGSVERGRSGSPHPGPLPRGAGEGGGCGRLVKNLYLPLPCFTIADFRGEAAQMGIPMPAWADLRGQAPACYKCWRIRAARLHNAEGWNLFVSHMTGGLLAGHEVERPWAEAPAEAKRMDKVGRHPVVGRVVARRARVRAMLLEGATAAEISAALGIERWMVHSDARAIYRGLGIEPERGRTRWAMVRKLEWAGTAGLDVAARLGLSGREGDVARLLCRGMSHREIAGELGISVSQSWQTAHRVYRKLGITERHRAELRARAGIGEVSRGEGGEARGLRLVG